MQVRGFHFDSEGVIVDVVPTWKKPRCGECGGHCGRIHDRRERRWRHLDIAGMKVQLRYKIRRAQCDSCGTVKTEQVPWSKGVGWYTDDFEERTAYLAQQSSKEDGQRVLARELEDCGANHRACRIALS